MPEYDKDHDSWVSHTGGLGKSFDSYSDAARYEAMQERRGGWGDSGGDKPNSFRGGNSSNSNISGIGFLCAISTIAFLIGCFTSFYVGNNHLEYRSYEIYGIIGAIVGSIFLAISIFCHYNDPGIASKYCVIMSILILIIACLILLSLPFTTS